MFANIAEPPKGLPALPIPERNPATPARIDLGRKLFFDRRLSFNRTLSCAMCHVPEQGFTQYEVKTPVGAEGRFIGRNAPTLLNVGYRAALFHDGRESTLENQVWQPLLKANEMANPSIGFVLATLRNAPDYQGLFEAAFDQGLTMETVGMALASYQRGLIAADSPFDRWYFGGNENALSEQARQGWELFRSLGCSDCHSVEQHHAHFTNDAFYDTGIGYARSMGIGLQPTTVRIAPGVEITPTVKFERPPGNDLGRYEATGRSSERWQFRVPTLRNVAITPPYMHDGSLPNLRAVIDYYDAGGVPHQGQDPRIRPLDLEEAEKAALVAFLESLTGSNIATLVEDARSQAIGDANLAQPRAVFSDRGAASL
ncbi:cytochrome-c peroxidase [Parahaliea maris]|uniref:cytochrome-c peroxidase n=1 Tax=Parahaliea maris TaxID=2716870 RepID=UPI001F2E1220|nr:cytochrome c peroxidase [Parahaliea maris]